MIKEIEQVGRLLESNQTGACLSFIESLESKHPDCACLTTAKLSVYRTENRWQEALSVAERFHTKEPTNPTAAAEYALALVVNGDPQRAVSTLVDAFEQSKADSVHSALLHAALQTATYMLLGGLVVPAIAMGHVLKEIPSIAEAANMFLFRATSGTNIPLMLRDWSFDYNCPDNFPGKEVFEEVVVLVHLMCWKQALTLLETLIPHADAWSGVWHNIAIVHFWLMNVEKGSEALKTYASLPNTSLEDAVDAETIRMLIIPDPLGDQTENLAIEYSVTDADQALEKALSDPLFFRTTFSEKSVSPPPRGVFYLLDRPAPAPEQALDMKSMAYHRAVALLFGKETDREARLLLQTLAVEDQETVETHLREVFGDLVQIPGNIAKRTSVSWSRMLVDCRLFLTPEHYPGRDALQKIIGEYYETVFPQMWLDHPLGVLDGKSPAEAAKESTYQIPLLAAIQLIEEWSEGTGVRIAPNLRSRLGLPAQETIVPAERSAEDTMPFLDSYPVWRWHRFDVSKLTTEVLSAGLQIVLGMHEMRSASRFAQELLSRPIDSMPFPTRIMAFEALITAAQADEDFDHALQWVERAKDESRSQNVPDAAWYLHEITLQLAKGNGQLAHDAIKYLVTNYEDNAAVMESLQELFIRLGMLNPDGTPSAGLAKTLAPITPQPNAPDFWSPSDVAPSNPGAPPSKLWVPD